MRATEALQKHIAEYNDILNAISVLNWDARTQMPHGGAETRGYQLATLARLANERFVSQKTADLLAAAEAEIANDDPDAYHVRAVRQTRTYYDLTQRIPVDIISEKAAVTTVAEQVWSEAKAENNFAKFAPHLQKIIDLSQAQADAIGYDAHPFDALVFEFEPSMTAAKLKALFEDLKAGLLPLLQAIVENDKPLPIDLWAREYPEDKQKAFALEMAKKFGYDLKRGRLDVAPHPFEISFTRNDVRITTRYNRNFLPMALFGTLHEAGHGLYEQGVSPQLTRTALTTDFLGQYAVGGTSYGVHESQSRLWENMIGRSRTFWELHFSQLQSHFPEQLGDVDADLFYRAINRVKPSLIRVEADEVTYNLHIMLRVEIEMGLLDGTIAVKDLPEFWNAKMEEYLGIVPPTDSLGVLQDIHWAGGQVGAFPGYTVGNVMSAQFLNAAHRDIPTLASSLEQGDYQPLLGWLTEHIYQHGRAYDGSELLIRSTGADLHVQPYLDYLTDKYTDLYQLA